MNNAGPVRWMRTGPAVIRRLSWSALLLVVRGASCEPVEMSRMRVSLLRTLPIVVALLACGSSDEHLQAARDEYERAIAIGDDAAAALAIEELDRGLGESPEAAIEVSSLFTRIGETNRALWRLEAGLERFPDSDILVLSLAQMAIQVGDAETALASLDRIPESSEASPAVPMLRARAQRDLGNLELSLATLEAAESTFSDWTNYRVERITMLVAEQRIEEALELIQDARTREGLDEAQRGWFDVSAASLLAKLGQTDVALPILAKATQDDPGDPEAWRRRFLVMVELEQLEALEAALQQALSERPDAGVLYELLSSLAARRGDIPAAEAYLRQRVEQEADEEGVTFLATYLLGMGRPEEAVAVLQGANEVESVELEYMLIAMLISMDDQLEARREFERFVQRHPSDPRVEYLRARFDIAAGNPARAATRLNRVLPRFDRSDLQHWLGVALEQSEDYHGAEYRYGLAVTRNPERLESYVGLIRMLSRRSDWPLLESVATEMLKYQPRSEVGLTALNRALFEQGKAGAVERIQRIYTEKFPEILEPHLALSVALRRQGRSAESLEVLDSRADIFGAKTHWRAERATVLGTLGRAADGLATLDLPDAEGDPAPIHQARAFLLLSAGQTDAGVAEVERALELAPDDPNPLRLLGDYHSGRGDFRAASLAYQRFLKLQPGDAEVHFRLGVARERTGDRSGAIESLRRAADLDAKAVEPRNNLAFLLEQEDRLDEALVAAQQAYALDDSSPMVLDTLGWIYLRMDRPGRAVAVLERALELAPKSTEVRYHLATAYAEAGRKPVARELFEELAATLASDDPYRERVADAIAGLR